MKVIPLTHGKETTVDEADFDLLMSIGVRWEAHKSSPGIWYARGYKYSDGRCSYVHPGRVILNAPPGLFVDHLDGDGLNNRRSNLRLCTNQQNQFNRGPNRRPRLSQYKGVSFIRSNSLPWVAILKFNGKKHWASKSATEIEAARKYDELARRHHGEFARLNFPDSRPVPDHP